MPGALLWRVMLWRGYDGFIYPKGDIVLGHVFFQRHATKLHGFSVAVDESHVGQGLSVMMLLDFVAYAARSPGITGARVGTGQNTASRRLLATLKEHAGDLGWRVEEDGWITFKA